MLLIDIVVLEVHIHSPTIFRLDDFHRVSRQR